jgi:DNA-binding NtrC family response regulator
MRNFNQGRESPAIAQAKTNPLDFMVGNSPLMQAMFRLITQVAPTRLTVLISGETGTGKELVARAIHALSDRAARPFVVVNCSAIPETLLEAELFGHTRGSFTGAVTARRGLLEEAHGGSLFLDEIATLTLPMQAKLLRVLEDHTIRKLGSNQPIPTDFRLIVATNEDLAHKVERGELREDLYYRLRVFPIDVPPLRERRGDIPLLAEHFRRAFAVHNGIVPPPFSPAMLERISSMHWPGNVRELEHFIERAIVVRLGADDLGYANDVPYIPDGSALVVRATDEEWSLERLENEYIRSVLAKVNGHRGRAAAVLGVDRRTLYRRLRGIGPSEA